jgi:uracil phosphoribosyltransferase
VYSVPVPVHIIQHPLVQDALVTLRDARTGPEEFRRTATRVSVLLAAEAMRDLPTDPRVVETPLGPAEGRAVAGDVVVVPVLRAGLGMLEAVLRIIPGARVGHLGFSATRRLPSPRSITRSSLPVSRRATCS